VGEKNLPQTSMWKSNGYIGMMKKLLDTISIEEYNKNIMFKEYLFEDKEWFVDLTDGLDLLDALEAQE
jgi:hypothetical protein